MTTKITGGQVEVPDASITGAKLAGGAVTPEKVSSSNGGLLSNVNGPLFGARAWVSFDGTTTPPTIFASGNVSSVGRSATGFFEINFIEAMPDANYAVVALGSFAQSERMGVEARSTTQTQIRTASASAQANPPLVCVAIFR